MVPKAMVRTSNKSEIWTRFKLTLKFLIFVLYYVVFFLSFFSFFPSFFPFLTCCSVAKLCPTLCTPQSATCQVSLSFTVSWGLLKFISIVLVMLSNHLILCCLLLLLSSIFPRIRVFSKELVLCIMWPKYWNFSFSISPTNECSELIFFRIDLFDLPAIQGTLKSLL